MLGNHFSGSLNSIKPLCGICTRGGLGGGVGGGDGRGSKGRVGWERGNEEGKKKPLIRVNRATDSLSPQVQAL